MAQPLEITGPRFATTNRESGLPIIGAFSTPISNRLKCDKNEEFRFAIRGRKEGRPDWRTVAHYFLEIRRKSRTNQPLGMAGPLFLGPKLE